MNRPDFSKYVAHFTKEKPPLTESQSNKPLFEALANTQTPYEKLVSILNTRVLYASEMPWVNKRAVCFTECTWASFPSHAEQYSEYGLGFKKKFIFNKGGNPVFYVRKDLYETQIWADEIHGFLTPFWPNYRSKELQTGKTGYAKTIDYSHEREWRILGNLEFGLEDVEFVVLKEYEDLAKLDKSLKDEIGRDKFILMNNYKFIEKTWPVHIK